MPEECLEYVVIDGWMDEHIRVKKKDKAKVGIFKGFD